MLKLTTAAVYVALMSGISTASGQVETELLPAAPLSAEPLQDGQFQVAAQSTSRPGAAPDKPTALMTDKDWAMQRKDMLAEIEYDMYRARHYTGRKKLSQSVADAVMKVERHKFVPDNVRSEAYANHPLPIGAQQTISQPFIVALMTELLDVDASSRVLEVGTGSGYQAAVLAEIVDRVYSVEIIPELAIRAEARLHKLGYRNIKVRQGDGTKGWERYAPFDAIVVTAAGIDIPDALTDQLKPGGKMVIPVGPQTMGQELLVVTRHEDGQLTEEKTIPVRFVPITH